jgi:hypothetical protein
MKTFSEFQEQIKTGGTIKKPTVIMPDGKELPGLGGGGGGTNAITDKSPAKSFKKRVKDVGKILTFPLHKKRVDPTEKFATEGAMAIPVAGIASKVLPAAAATVGAIGTMMQARKKGKRKLSAAEKKLFDKSQRDTDQRGDLIKSNPGEIDKQNKLIDRYSKRHKTPKQKNDTQKFLKGLARGEIIQDEFSAPTNNVGGGKIAGTVEAGDDPPVKKKKRYIYGGTGSRKMWLAKNNK